LAKRRCWLPTIQLASLRHAPSEGRRGQYILRRVMMRRDRLPIQHSMRLPSGVSRRTRSVQRTSPHCHHGCRCHCCAFHHKGMLIILRCSRTRTQTICCCHETHHLFAYPPRPSQSSSTQHRQRVPNGRTPKTTRPVCGSSASCSGQAVRVHATAWRVVALADLHVGRRVPQILASGEEMYWWPEQLHAERGRRPAR